MAVLKACIGCGKPAPQSYCDTCKPVSSSSRRRDSSGLSGGAWETIRKKVLKRDNGTCYLCNRVDVEDDPLEVDHLIEVARGGSNHLSNLASAHKSCHLRRHSDPEWAQDRVRRALSALGAVVEGTHPGGKPRRSAAVRTPRGLSARAQEPSRGTE